MRRTISNTTQNTYNIHLFSCLFRMRFFPSSHFLTFASLDLMRSPQFSDKPKLVMQWAEAAVCSTVLDFLTFKTNKSNIFKMQFDKIAVYHSLLWQRRWRRLVSYITRIHAFYHSMYIVQCTLFWFGEIGNEVNPNKLRSAFDIIIRSQDMSLCFVFLYHFCILQNFFEWIFDIYEEDKNQQVSNLRK